MLIKRIDPLGRITIPKEIRERIGLRAGGQVEITTKDGRIVLRNINIDTLRIKEAVAILEDCGVDISVLKIPE